MLESLQLGRVFGFGQRLVQRQDAPNTRPNPRQQVDDSVVDADRTDHFEAAFGDTVKLIGAGSAAFTVDLLTTIRPGIVVSATDQY